MKIRATTVVLLASFIAAPAFAADAAAPVANPQQNKMADCNKQATGKQGDERKQFMSSCLKAQPAAATTIVAQPLDPKAAMGACNKAAADKNLAGAERKTWMSGCLKAKGPDLMPK